ncbi:MAG: hypothetical protein ACKOE2_10120 [Actinomycetales bacterium]
MIVKGGFPAWGVTGDPNATIDSAEPLVLGPQFGGIGPVPADLSVLFTNEAAIAEGTTAVARRLVPVRNCRTVRNRDLIRHGVLGTVEVAPDGSQVRFDSEPIGMDPVTSVPISRLHFW